ncbi:type II toxin-antitoxin system RelE family toxin [Variovorax sp. RHLX14]|jgi:mRNA interferase RelE/StbE|uniref:type II toxin-antitoxin system RelE family toxin n=1 Tax=Variovorax sp. RHLX14 TaxID=1259731 RepID=UPI003F46CF9B
MAWKVELSGQGQRHLDALDRQVARRVLSFLFERVAQLEDPRSIGDALKGSRLGHLWRYRVGDFRVICDLQDNTLTVLVVSVGNRREVYK